MNKSVNKKFKYGAYSTVATIVVIAVLVAVNLVAGEFDYKFDMTSESIFSLSKETEEVLKNTDADVKIYTLFGAKDSDTVISRVEQVLDLYRLADSNISVENKDMYLYPDFASSYTSEDINVDKNSIIVQCGDKFKVINYSDYYDSKGNFNIEEYVTGAIQYVTSQVEPTIYYVTGHGEAEPENYALLDQQLKLNNYSVESINLLESDIPDDCTMLFITMGAKDYSEEEAQKVKDYLTADGRALIIVSGIDSSTHPGLCSVIEEYGLEAMSGYVLEGDESRYMAGTPAAVLPEINAHGITSDIIDSGYSMLAYMTQAFKESDVKKQGLVIEPLIASSDMSFIKNAQNTSFNKEPGDIEGPFVLAYAVTDSDYTDTSHTTKVVVSGAYSMLIPDYDMYVNGSGTTFIMNAVKWLDDNSLSVNIRSKRLDSGTFTVSDGDRTKIQVLSWAVIPGILFLCGFVVWLRRRNG